jgi:predicted component of type VI protein secretion system
MNNNQRYELKQILRKQRKINVNQKLLDKQKAEILFQEKTLKNEFLKDSNNNNLEIWNSTIAEIETEIDQQLNLTKDERY